VRGDPRSVGSALAPWYPKRVSGPAFHGRGGPRGGALVKRAQLVPAWQPDPPGPLSSDSVPERYVLPAAPYSPRPDLFVGICVGTAAAAPFVLFGLPLWGFVATFAAVFGGARYMQARRIRRWRQGLLEAFDELERGDYAAAEETFRRVALAQRHPLLRAASADFGYLALRRGDYQNALAIYSRAWRSQLIGAELRANVEASIATTYACLGELEAAEKWLPPAEHWVTPSGGAVVLCRLGRFAETLELEMPPLRRWQESFLRHERRLLYLTRAYALRELGEPNDVVHAHLDLAAPAYPGEFDYVSASWPRLRELLAERVD
jgi:tetratricopeptide (TPR) repeat protein